MSKSPAKDLRSHAEKAMEWAAKELKFVSRFKLLLKGINENTSAPKEIRMIRTALHIYRYAAQAEKRAAMFESLSEDDLKTIWNITKSTAFEHMASLKQIPTLLDELKIEHDTLFRYLSFYDGQLKKELDQTAALAKLEEKLTEDYPRKGASIHEKLSLTLKYLYCEIDKSERWIESLEATLKKIANLPIPGEENIARDKFRLFTREPKDIQDFIRMYGLGSSYKYQKLKGRIRKSDKQIILRETISEATSLAKDFYSWIIKKVPNKGYGVIFVFPLCMSGLAAIFYQGVCKVVAPKAKIFLSPNPRTNGSDFESKIKKFINPSIHTVIVIDDFARGKQLNMIATYLHAIGFKGKIYPRSREEFDEYDTRRIRNLHEVLGATGSPHQIWDRDGKYYGGTFYKRREHKFILRKTYHLGVAAAKEGMKL